jgi:altronate dehydratase
MNLHVFTTGRGTPYGLAMVPVVKVSSRTELAERWPDLIDVDAGRIASGQSTVEEIGWELFHYYLDVASGRKKTRVRRRGHSTPTGDRNDHWGTAGAQKRLRSALCFGGHRP